MICDRRNGVRPVILRGSNPQDRMSALGQKRTFTHLLSPIHQDSFPKLRDDLIQAATAFAERATVTAADGLGAEPST